ncbi:MAG: hypothetical protein ACI8XO_002798 [Verrucomicrobiales bacterium]|jgi:hypothetical protein
MGERLQCLKRWLLPLLLLVLALVVVSILLGKMRRDVWAYYTDGEGVRTDAQDEQARPVLWQDPEPQYFEDRVEGDTLEAAFSADGTTMVLVRRGEEGADLYVSDWDGRKWSPPRALSSINTGANERSPELSRDGRSLYFSSDRKGGAGGYDLFVARLDGANWKQARVLPTAINSKADELGAALSADGARLYFSSNRNGGKDDIFVSEISSVDKNVKFGEAQPVDDLNSEAADIQAALTSRGDHVFIASDRDRDEKSGFRVYISRVVDGEPLPPEEVDLYIDNGDVTDPAVRMDGFDLLFSSGESEDSGYQLYRSTTREVVGYTDMSRWEDFKTLMGDIAWWLVLAAAALIALIYILEKWRDMTTLFHKCLASSAVLHLVALLVAMLWLIAQQIEEESPSEQEVSVSIDALAEEELAMESVPEETQLTDATTNLESEKVEAEFGAPGFEEQQDAEAMPELARTVKEADLVEVQLAKSEPSTEPVPELPVETSLLSDLEATALPTVDTPVLEEADPSQPVEVADSSEDTFEPEVMETAETAKTETTEVADAAIETEVEPERVTEVHESVPLEEAPKESAVEATMAEIPSELPSEQLPLESAMLSELEVAEFVDPAEMSLDEGAPAAAESPADTGADEFSPEGAVASLNSEPAQGQAVADSAMASAADAGAVAAGEAGEQASAIDAVDTTVGSSGAAEESLPVTEFEIGDIGGLPEMAMTDPGAPMLEESDAVDAGAPANPSDDLFKPDQSAPALSTAPAKSEGVADSAEVVPAELAAVSGGEMVISSPAVDARPSPLVASAPAESVPPMGAEPAEIGALPEMAMTDPGAPMLEESDAVDAGAPANPSDDLFKPDQSAPALSTAPAKSEGVADSAEVVPAELAAVSGGEMVISSPAVDARPSPLVASAPTDSVPPMGAEPAEIGALPEMALIDPGAPKLEEAGQVAAVAAADPSKEMFTPGGSAQRLEVDQAKPAGVADSAVAEAVEAAKVVRGGMVVDSAIEASRPPVKSEARGTEELPPSKLEVGLPELALVETGAPQLEEGGKVGGSVPADTSKDLFTPGNAVPTLETAPAGTRALAELAVTDRGAAGSIAEAPSDKVGAAILTPSKLEAIGSLPNLDAGGLAPELAVTTPMAALLPSKLEVDREMDPKGMAVAVQKQRGKPGIDTIKQMGGSDGTEKAISAAIEWLVKNQEEAGHWDTRKHGAKQNFDSGGTGLVLLCFFGWGERHDQACQYQDNVRRALDWLLKQQRKEDGYLGEAPGMMYSHAIATIALCEGYGLTKDKRLRGPAERAIAYSLAAQSKSRGGWRYSPGEDSDTSVTGWQYMALHSARMAGLEVPQEAFDRARGFLDKMGGGKHGGLYGYQQRGKLSRAMVATGMFCRQLDLVPPSQPMMQESARLLKLHKMKSERPDLYYVYYATLALYQHQGPIWQAWNERLKEILPQLQSGDGSWDPSGSMAGDGGRVISTTLSTLSLEVYYRLLPMYGFRNGEAKTPEQKTRAEN